jgi:hypothetical protein
MKLMMRSMISGNVNTLELPMTLDEFNVAHDKWKNEGVFIQDAFPMLSPDLREFVKTGITPEEWNNIFGDEE